MRTPTKEYFYLALHSILVKSILDELGSQFNNRNLYIPFWLNLYNNRMSDSFILFRLYIPFWLNLYQLINARSENNDTTLHSILVKSIPKCRSNYGRRAADFTFHSG